MTPKEHIPKDSKVTGIYHGVPFKGTVMEVYCAYGKGAGFNYHIFLETPIVVMNSQREGLFIEYNSPFANVQKVA